MADLIEIDYSMSIFEISKQGLVDIVDKCQNRTFA
jgi:hypothetical protein